MDDAVSAFLLVLEKGSVGEVYNVGTNCEIPIVQLARELVKMVGRAVNTIKPPKTSGDSSEPSSTGEKRARRGAERLAGVCSRQVSQEVEPADPGP